MLVINNTYQSAEENMAFEAAYFQEFEEDTLRIWRNPNAVIIGKHQNAYSESNLLFCQENDIPILRRISGGGTVFHDHGNINFSFFRFVDKANQINYADNLRIITQTLERLGYQIWVNQRHDIYSGDAKISGNAQHVSRGRALHHGTILYDTDIELLRKSIKKHFGKFTDKSVKSFRSNVMNLRDDKDLGSNDDFFEKFFSVVSDFGTYAEISVDISEHIHPYYSDKWNFDYGPKFLFESDDSELPFSIEVERGKEISMTNSSLREIQNILEDFPEPFRFKQIATYLERTESATAMKMNRIIFS